jgi:hypothetical protein
MMAEYKLTPGCAVTRLSDGASIPPDPANVDYAAFLAWQEAGGVPDPVDPPDPRHVVISQIAALEASITDRRWREAGPDDAGGTAAGRAWMLHISDQIAALRGAL